MPEAKPYVISKQVVWEAYQKVKANHGAAGVDGQSIEAFETDLKGNLYKIWNRMSSGSYFPPPVRLVEIPKASGGSRPLGIPTVGDRVAQMVVKMHLEPLVEPHFHPDSYGYRPGKSALDAVATARERCWRSDCVIDLDIKGFFDNLDHELVMKRAVASRRGPVGPAVHRTVASSPRSKAGRQSRRANEGLTSRVGRFTPVGESLHALCVRPLDAPDLSGHPVRALCRRCDHSRQEPGSSGAGARSGPAVG